MPRELISSSASASLSLSEEAASPSSGAAAEAGGFADGGDAADAPAGVVLAEEAEFPQAVHEFEEGLFAEVAQAEELLVGLFQDLADGHEAAALEAVVGADGEAEVFDGGVVALGAEAEGFAGLGFGGLGRGTEVDEEAEFALEDLGGLADGVFAADGAVRPDFQDEAVEVAFLADAGGLDGVVDLANGGEDGVQRDDADRHAVGVAGGDEAAAALDVEGGGEVGFGGVQGGDVGVGVDDFVVAGDFEVGGGDGAFARDVEEEFGGAVGEGAQADAADVEEQFGGVFLDVLDGGEFVLDLVDANGDDGGAGEGAEEEAAEGVADGGAEAAREGLGDDAGIGVGGFLGLQAGGCLAR